MTDEQIFRDWWMDSYGTPPGKHAEMTHVAFAQHLVNLALDQWKEGALDAYERAYNDIMEGDEEVQSCLADR